MRTEWSRHAPQDVEDAIAMMLARRYETAQQVRPGQGDGGIDIQVPPSLRATLQVEEPAGLVIYQVKSFWDRMTSNRWKKVQESLRKVIETASAKGLDIAEWRLIMPLNLTADKDQRDFARFAANAPFRCTWQGLNHVDELAAAYPHVIDEWFHDGRARRDAELGRLHRVLLPTPGEEVADAAQRLADVVHTINDLDNDYRYEFHVSRSPALEPEHPLFKFTSLHQIGDDVVTIYVFARSRYSSERRPVPVQLRVRQVDPDEWERWRVFGVPVRVTADVTVDAPGGLGGSWSKIEVLLGRQRNNVEHQVLRLWVIDRLGSTLGPLLLDMLAPTMGPSGEGIHMVGHEINGAFDVAIGTNLVTNVTHLEIKLADLAGRAPSAVRDGLRILLAMPTARSYRMGPRYGKLPETMPVYRNTGGLEEGAAWLQQLVEALDALDLVQQQTEVQLTLPESDVFDDQLSSYLVAGRLLNGEHVQFKQRSPMKFVGHSAVVAGDEHALFTVQPWIFKVGSQEVDLGMRATHLSHARVLDVEELGDGTSEVTMVPVGDVLADTYWAPEGAPGIGIGEML